MATASLITRSCKSWDSLVEYARCGRHPPPVILDEVQYAPGLFRHLKAAVDRERGRYGAFLLTGSQPLGLMESVSDSLAGRAAVIELEPLSFAEAKGAYPDLTAEQFLVRGGFPELYENRDIDAEGFFRSYVATYLERDLRQLLQVTSLRDFERFMRAAALRSAQLLNRARPRARRRRQRLHRRSLAVGAGRVPSDHAAGAVVREPDEGTRQAAETVPARRGAHSVSVRGAHDRGATVITARRRTVGDSRLRRDPPRSVEPPRRLGLPFLG